MRCARPVAARTGKALAVVALAAFAAALAHLTIDAIGDVALAHDTYDEISHDTRTAAAATSAALFCAAVARSMYDALRCALGLRVARAAFTIAAPRRFAAGVVALTIPFVAGMEAIDAALAGHRAGTLADLFGGSLSLGLSTTIATALAVALAAFAMLKMLWTTRTFMITIISGLLALRRRAPVRALTSSARRRACAIARFDLKLVTRKRGPPLLISS